MARVIVKVLVTTVTVLTLGPISSVADELSGEALYGLACAACHNSAFRSTTVLVRR